MQLHRDNSICRNYCLFADCAAQDQFELPCIAICDPAPVFIWLASLQAWHTHVHVCFGFWVAMCRNIPQLKSARYICDFLIEEHRLKAWASLRWTHYDLESFATIIAEYCREAYFEKSTFAFFYWHCDAPWCATPLQKICKACYS